MSGRSRVGLRPTLFVLFALRLTLFASPCRAVPGDENWSSLFGTPGADQSVNALLVEGDDLIVGGQFSIIGGISANRIARYDGNQWHPYGAGFNGEVRAIVRWNGQLLAAGTFTTADGQPASRVASWNGSQWQPLGAGLDGSVHTLAVYGSILVAGGNFAKAGGAPAARIAAWDGVAWSPLGSGLNDQPYCTAVHDGRLIVGGAFTTAGGTAATHVAAWDGTAWSALGTGTGYLATSMVSTAAGLLVGTTECLNAPVICGAALVRWDGDVWTTVLQPYSGDKFALAEQNGEIVFGADATWMPIDQGQAWYSMSFFNGSQWQGMAPLRGFNSPPRSAAFYRGGVVVAGGFNTVSGAGLSGLAWWDRTSWHPIGPATPHGGLELPVSALALYGGRLIAGGNFERAGDSATAYYAQWDGATWSSVGSAYFNPTRYDGGSMVEDLLVIDDKLYMAGGFDLYDMDATTSIAQFDGQRWRSAGGGCGGSGFPVVQRLTNHMGQLVAGGDFTEIGGLTASGLARLAGYFWQPIPPPVSYLGWVSALGSYHRRLYLAQQGSTVLRSWNGTAWSNVPGLTGPVYALFVWGDRLVAGGGFTIDGEAASVAAWDGLTWEILGQASGNRAMVYSLAETGGRLFAGGLFSSMNGIAARNIAAWDGVSWQPLGSGVDGEVSRLVAENGSLYAGGGFHLAGGRSSFYVALWSEPAVAVRLASFTATRGAEGAVIRWSVAEAEDHAGFRLFRGAPGAPADDRIDLSGVVAGKSSYEFVDAQPPAGAAEYWLLEISRAGSTDWHGPVMLAAAASATPAGSLTASPNPFRDSVRLGVTGGSGGSLDVAIFDVRGVEVRRLTMDPGATASPGIAWDGRDEFGRDLPPGSYFVRPRGSTTVSGLKIVRLR